MSDTRMAQWYELLQREPGLTQGDIIFNCPVLVSTNHVYEAAHTSDPERLGEVGLKTYDIVILSQACDLAHEKIDTAIVCALWPLSRLVSTNSYYKSSKAKEDLRQGKEPAYHLINEFQSNALSIELSVVDFHRIYTVPKDYLRRIAAEADARLRLLSPYREHLSQAFARYFMRVGLPVDIDRRRVREVGTGDGTPK